MGEIRRLADDAERRLGRDPVKMRAAADEMEAAAADRSVFARIAVGFFCSELRLRAKRLDQVKEGGN